MKPTIRGKRRRKPAIRRFRMTASSFDYDERRHQPIELEMYLNISRAARTTANIRRVRSELEQKGRKHFRYWILKHLNLRLERAVHVNFEKEQRSERQVEQSYASVRRLMMRRVDRRWVAENLPSGKMRFAKRRRRHGRR
jgi:hypothetical protein